MNCEMVGHLMDDYLENELSQRDRHLLEEHLGRCQRCVQELRRRPAFERGLRRALAGSVQPLTLSPDASLRIVRAAEESLQRAVWSHRAAQTLHALAGMAALALVLVGAFFVSRGFPAHTRLQPVALFPVNQMPLSDLHSASLSPDDRLVSRPVDPPPRVLPQANLLFEPRNMYPSQPFTITVMLQSDTPNPPTSLQLDLDLNGPTGYYRFDLALQEPLPSRGVSVLRVTPDLLAGACEERYLISPADLFGQTGVYDLRLTMTAPVARQP